MLEYDNLADQLGGNIDLTKDERVEMTAFLNTLTDKEFLFNKKIDYPK